MINSYLNKNKQTRERFYALGAERKKRKTKIDRKIDR